MKRARPRSEASTTPLVATPELSPLVEQLRELLRGLSPDIEERVYAGSVAAGYHDPHAGAFCGLFIGRTSVRLEFPRGVPQDPDHLVTAGRYMEFRPGNRIRRGPLTRLLHRVLLTASLDR